MTVAVRVSGLPGRMGALDGRLFLDNTMLTFIEHRTALAIPRSLGIPLSLSSRIRHNQAKARPRAGMLPR